MATNKNGLDRFLAFSVAVVGVVGLAELMGFAIIEVELGASIGAKKGKESADKIIVEV